MAKPFLYIYAFFARHRKIYFGVLAGLFLIMGYSALKIKPEEDISKILPKDRQAEKLSELLRQARFADKLVMMVSGKESSELSPEILSAFSDSFSFRLLQRYPHLVRSVENRVDENLFPLLTGILNRHLPIYLDPEDYPRMDSMMDEAVVAASLSRDRQMLSSPAGMLMKDRISHDPLGIANPVFKKIRQIQYDDNFELYDGHVMSKDGRYLLFFINPAYPADNTGKNSQLLRGIDQVTTELQGKGFDQVNAVYFGAVAVAAGNAAQLRKDSILTLGITTVFLMVLISWYFRRKKAPLLILMPVILGALFALSMMYWLQGTISVIALAAGSIVLGIAINYSLHVYNHFRHRHDMKAVLEDLSFPLTIGGFTTIGGFLCLQFVQSEILKDLGLFAAFSLIGASLSSLIFLPHLIEDPNSKKKEDPSLERDSWIWRLANYHPEKNKWLVLTILVLTIVFANYMNRVGFDQDMMHMNYMPESLKKAESTLNQINAFSLRSVYLITDGQNLQSALRKQEYVNDKMNRLHQKNIIKKYSGVFQLLISDSLQRKRIQSWNSYWTPERKARLLSLTRKAALEAGFTANAMDSFETALYKDYQPLDTAETQMLINGFAHDYILTRPGQVSLVSLLQVEPADKKIVYQAFGSMDDVTVTDRQYMTSRLLDLVTADFSQIGWMTSILVLIVLWLTYGRIELTLVSFIPMVIAFIWILGIMGMAGLQFNIVNIILSALIFGLGDDYSLFIMDGLLQEYKTGKKNLASYKSSIVLSAITTLAGLGVLIFAKHPALRSIAFISITGILCVVLIAQVLIPFFFQFLIRRRIQKGFFPWTAAGLLKSSFSLSYFALGSWLVTLVGLILVKGNPWAGSRCRHLYHRLLSSYTWSVLYIMGNVKKTIINERQEDFSKPCVMIANHQSFLDILVMTMLYPKVILLTNDWVWRSPVFGLLVRIAGYYPVSRGIENSIPYLRKQVKAGYSIAVFPEGTRSADERIRRFHKGAFFIAEKLNLDILPILIHGTGYTMSKGDFLLKDGHLTIQYLPRIEPQNLYYGVDYTERAKYLGQYYRKQYALCKASFETPRYFREQLMYNYIYKGPILEWYLRVKIRKENDYQAFHDLLPREGLILDMGCGYGFMSYLLHLAADGRTVTGYDHDEEKIAVANHCFSRDPRIHFVQADIGQITVAPADGIILSDVLHYLDPVRQEVLVRQCMEAIRPGGVLIIRDGDRDLSCRHRVTRLTEFFSTRVFSFNKTDGPLHFLSGRTIRDLAQRQNMECRILDKASRSSNLLFIISHRAKSYEKV